MSGLPSIRPPWGGSKPPVTPIPPTPPASKYINCTTAGDRGADIPVLVTDGPPPHKFPSANDPTLANRVTFTIPGAETGGYRIDFADHSVRPSTPLPMSGASEGPLLDYGPPKPILKPLRVDGGFFCTDDGPHTVIQCSAFKDLQLMISGGKEALTATYTQARDLGFNDRRVFSTGKNDFVQLEPSPAYWSNAHRMLDYGAEFGQRFTIVVLVDVHALGWSLQQQIDHWAEWGGVLLQHANGRQSLANEIDQQPNIIDPTKFDPIPGVLCSRGSHGGTNGGTPGEPYGSGVLPCMDWGECHSNGQKKAEQEEQRVPAHLCLEMTNGEGDTPASHKPTECSEMSRFPDQWAGYDQARLEAVAFAIGQSSALLGAGACMHSPEGRISQPFAAALPYARKFAEGARSVPLRFQKGQYNRIDDPNYLRVYERILGAESFVSRIPK